MMVELNPKPTATQNYSADSFSKDLAVQSLPSNSSGYIVDDVDIEEGGRTMTEKGDIGTYPDGLNDLQNDLQNGEWGGKEGPVTRTSTKSSWKDPGPPPDGGWSAWTQGMYTSSSTSACRSLKVRMELDVLQAIRPYCKAVPGNSVTNSNTVALGHLVLMNTWGFINSFGVFQTYYVTALNRPPSDVSLVGSIQVFLLFFIGTFTGRLTDAGYFRSVFLIGSFLGTFGIFMASLSTTYWQLFLAQGVCCGLGNGFLLCPALSLLSTYFSKKRSLAIGLAAAGSGTGGMVFPAIV
jgi:hypothetical protein